MMHNSVGVVWRTAPAEGIWKVIAAINPQFFRHKGAAAASKDSFRTSNTHIQTHRKTYQGIQKITRLALAAWIWLHKRKVKSRQLFSNFQCIMLIVSPLSLDDRVEIRRVFSPPLLFILDTLYWTVVCSVLNFARFANHCDLILLCLYQIYSITDCYTSSNFPSLSAVFLSPRFMSRV